MRIQCEISEREYDLQVSISRGYPVRSGWEEGWQWWRYVTDAV